MVSRQHNALAGVQSALDVIRDNDDNSKVDTPNAQEARSASQLVQANRKEMTSGKSSNNSRKPSHDSQLPMIKKIAESPYL